MFKVSDLFILSVVSFGSAQKMAKEVPQSINLLTPVNTPEDTWERLYDWLFSFGRFILIGVLVVVLAVFLVRFQVGRRSNDLTRDVNSLSATLSSDFFRSNEIKYNNWHTLFADLNRISDEQVINSTQVASVIESVPSDVELLDISYTSGRFSLNCVANDFQAIQRYESLLKKNPNYDQDTLRVNLNKSGNVGNKIEFSLGFNVKAVDPLASSQATAAQ